MPRRTHYGEYTLSMCRTTQNASAMTMERAEVTCGICLEHLDRGVNLYRPQGNHLGDWHPQQTADSAGRAVELTPMPPEVSQTAQITAYTDGAAEPNPGPGGCGAVVYGLPDRAGPLEISQCYRRTTNNRMEIMGVIVALEATPDRSSVEVFSDSKYVSDAMTKGWIGKWKSKDWNRGKDQPVLNDDLWKLLASLVDTREVKFSWVKGHSGNPGNERADALATAALHAPNLPVDSGYTGSAAPQPAGGPSSWAPARNGGHFRRYGPYNLTLKQFGESPDWNGVIYFSDERQFGWRNLGGFGRGSEGIRK